MLHCNIEVAAMQTNGLLLVSGIHNLIADHETDAASTKGNTMPKTATFGFAPSATLFGRLLATIDRLLMANATIAIRNGDLPYFGL
jgi:hypothetical protein